MGFLLKTVLVIDDEPEIREVLRAFLQRNGFQVVLAEDGIQGVEVCKNQTVDLVITDLLMPEQEGIETILQIRNDHPNLPILAMSGGGRMAGTMDILHTAKLLGAIKTFSKPFNPVELVDTVKQLLA